MWTSVNSTITISEMDEGEIMVSDKEILLDGLVREIIDTAMEEASYMVSDFKNSYPELDEETIKDAIDRIDEYAKDSSSDIVALIIDSQNG